MCILTYGATTCAAPNWTRRPAERRLLRARRHTLQPRSNFEGDAVDLMPADGRLSHQVRARTAAGSRVSRSERTGNLRVTEDGRRYQADFTATDGNEGSCMGSVLLGVPHDQRQHSLPRDNGCRWDSTTGAPLAACARSADSKR
jgi:hypothetical protein